MGVRYGGGQGGAKCTLFTVRFTVVHAVQCIVQYMPVHCAIQFIVQCSALYNTVQCGVQCTIHSSQVQCSQCSSVQFSAGHRRRVGLQCIVQFLCAVCSE